MTKEMKKILFIGILLIGLLTNAQNNKYTTYRVLDYETVTSIAKKLEVTTHVLLYLNPDAKGGINIDEVLIIPNKNYVKEAIIKKTEPLVIKDSIIDGVLYHTVKPSETIYSLSRKYKVSKRNTRKLNNLSSSEIAINQVLKFPTDLPNCCTKKIQKKRKVVKTNIQSAEVTTDDYIYYTVKDHETLYGISKKYKVSESKLKALNPIIGEGLEIEMILRIPKHVTDETVSKIDTLQAVDTIKVEPKYILHKVRAKEGFFRLKQLYGISKEEILKANPKLKDGLKLGMEIRIPEKNESFFIEGVLKRKVLNVVMMLPIKATDSIPFSEKTKASKKLNNVIDFYLGSLMALDSVKKKGLSVNLKVFDTKNSDFVVNSILSSYDFNATDVVIAPIKFSQFKKLALRLESKEIPVLSPFSKKDHGSIGVKNTIQNSAPDSVLANSMISYIRENYNGQKLIIVADEKRPKPNFNIEWVKKELLKDTIKDVAVIRMDEDGIIKHQYFVENIDEEKENWVILASNKEVTSSITVGNLAVFSDKFKIKLFSLVKPTNIDHNIKSGYKILYKDLNKLNFQYPTISFIDEENPKVSLFNKTYRAQYGSVPTLFSYKGFDTTYDMLIRLASCDVNSNSFLLGKSYRMSSQFDYSMDELTIVNKGVFFVRYHNYKVEKVY